MARRRANAVKNRKKRAIARKLKPVRKGAKVVARKNKKKRAVARKR